ncbi:MAG: hypothetical protein ACHQF4_06560 [Sphingobacteriales bacterium]
MNKKILIISPYFAPTIAADMHRVRMSLPYYARFGWDAEVVTVDPKYSDFVKDELLLESIPTSIRIHHVKALDKQWTSMFGLGSIALRSLYFYYIKVAGLLKTGKYNLIYFSTTQFPVCILGYYWNKKFNVPYLIDFQDPWHTDYYEHKPKGERPPKYWFSYRLNRFFEAIAMKRVTGLITVTGAYITMLSERYPWVTQLPSSIVTFGAFKRDFQIAEKNEVKSYIERSRGKIAIAYVGVVGEIMAPALTALFKCLHTIKRNDTQLYQTFEWFFIGTSYAPPGTGKKTVMPIAETFGVGDYVHEQTERISYFEALKTIMTADALLVIGSDEPTYTASKLYPYLLTNKPLLAIFNSKSSALQILKEYDSKYAYSYDSSTDIELKINDFLKKLAAGELGEQRYNADAIDKYSAENMARRQCELFDRVVDNK